MAWMPCLEAAHSHITILRMPHSHPGLGPCDVNAGSWSPVFIQSVYYVLQNEGNMKITFYFPLEGISAAGSYLKEILCWGSLQLRGGSALLRKRWA